MHGHRCLGLLLGKVAHGCSNGKIPAERKNDGQFVKRRYVWSILELGTMDERQEGIAHGNGNGAWQCGREDAEAANIKPSAGIVSRICAAVALFVFLKGNLRALVGVP